MFCSASDDNATQKKVGANARKQKFLGPGNLSEKRTAGYFSSAGLENFGIMNESTSSGEIIYHPTTF